MARLWWAAVVGAALVLGCGSSERSRASHDSAALSTVGDPYGQSIWERSLPQQGVQFSQVDSDGNLLLLTITPTGDGYATFSVEKRSADASQLLWSTQVADSHECQVTGEVVTSLGNTLVSTSCNGTNPGTADYPTGSVIKLNPDGSVAWQDQSAVWNAITTDTHGSAVVSSDMFDQYIQHAGHAVLRKYAFDGTIAFTKDLTDQSGHGTLLQLRALASDSSDDIIGVGDVYGPYTLDGHSVQGTQNGTPVIFKFDANGNVLWAKDFHAIYGGLWAVGTSAAGTIVAAGHASSDLTWAGTNVGTGYVILVAEPDGTERWGKLFPRDIDSIAVDPAGEVAIGGHDLNECSPISVDEWNLAGNALWSRSFQPTGCQNQAAQPSTFPEVSIRSSDHTVLVTGRVINAPVGYNFGGQYPCCGDGTLSMSPQDGWAFELTNGAPDQNQIVAYDDFNQTSTALSSNWWVPSGAFTVSGNTARGTAASSYAAWNNPVPADATVSVDITLPETKATYFGVFGRANTSAPTRDHYVAYIDTTGHIGIARRNAYNYTFLGTGPVIAAGKHTLGLTVSGTNPVSLSATIDGTERLHANDSSSSRLSSGYAGIFDYNGASQPMDNFVVTSLSAPTGGGTDGGTGGGADGGTGGSDGGTGGTDGGTGGGVDGGTGGGTDGGTGGATVVFTDNFNRSGSLGSNWSVASGSWTDNGSAATGTSAQSYAFWTGSPATDDTISITLSTPIRNTYVGVIAHANPSAPASDHYVAYVDPSGQIHLARRINDVYSYLADGPTFPSGSHVLGINAAHANPVVISVTLDGNEVIHFSDASGSALDSGEAGILDYNGAGQPIDSFTVTTSGTTGGGGTGGTGGTGSSATFSDAFNRSGALGSNWFIESGTWSDNGTAARGTASQSYAFWTGSPGANDTATITLATPILNTFVGVIVRGTTSIPFRDHYVAYADPSGQIHLARRNGYTYSYLADGPTFPSGSHTLSLTATGTSPVVLSVKLDGAEVIHFSDSSSSALTAAGKDGMLDYNGAGQPIDAFQVAP